MPWYKVVSDSPASGLQLLEIARRVDDAAGRPIGFAVFTAHEIQEDEYTVLFVHYFSPVAAEQMLPYISHLSPDKCGVPVLDFELGDGMLYGPPDGLDLLG